MLGAKSNENNSVFSEEDVSIGKLALPKGPIYGRGDS